MKMNSTLPSHLGHAILSISILLAIVRASPPGVTTTFHGNGGSHSNHPPDWDADNGHNAHYHYHQHRQGDGPLPTFGRSGSGSNNVHHNNGGSLNGCSLAESWRGKWFLSGNNLQPVIIDEKSITTKGNCIESAHDQFLFYDKILHCHKCLVINERHRNVLQYKESSDCEPEKDLENLCSTINGDAQLFSLFRLDTDPEECPFRGAPFNLTYSRGNGECKEPISRIDACTHNSKLLLRLQACPNVEKTESKVEELECLAHWQEGSNHYLLGKLEGPIGNSNYEEKFRCFIWKRIKEQDVNGHSIIKYKVAQSDDATCAGVISATEGARALTLTKLEQGSGDKCKFPYWVAAHHWHTLDGKISFKIHNKNTTLHIGELGKRNSSYGGGAYHNPTSGLSLQHRYVSSILVDGSRLSCQSRFDISAHHTVITAHHLDGCKSESVCLNVFKRDGHVIELRLGRKLSHGDCPSGSLSGEEGSIVTLLSASVASHRCPNLGKYMATGVTTTDIRVVRESCDGTPLFNSVAVGCGDRGTMEFHSKCAIEEPITSYTCHGNWREGGTGYLIASPLSRASTGARRFCFIYTESEAGLQVSRSSESCRRNLSPGIDGNWAFNLTTQGPCAEKFTSGHGIGSVHQSKFLYPALLSVIFIISISQINESHQLISIPNNSRS